MKPLRILQVTNRLPWPLNDGGNIATYHVAAELVRRGHDVRLAALNTRKHHQDPAEVPTYRAIHTVDIDTALRPWGLIAGLLRAHPYNVQRFWSPDFERLLAKLLADFDPDIVQIEGSYLSLYSQTLRQARARLVMRSHNVEHRIWNRLATAERNPLKRAYLRNLGPKIERFERQHLGDYHGIAAIAQPDTEWYAAQGFRGHLRTITGGVDLTRFQPAKAEGAAGRICFLGSLEWLPNVQGLDWFLAEVWPALRRRHPGVECWVAGKNPPQGYLSDAPEGVKMLGMVPDSAAFLAQCGVMVVPLFSGGGMRMKLLEAMAAGMAVVSTAVGAEGVEGGGAVLQVEGAGAWIEALAALLGDPGRCVRMGAEARAIAERRYGWAAVGEAFEEFYGEVLA